jgi:hypothetical protein
MQPDHERVGRHGTTGETWGDGACAEDGKQQQLGVGVASWTSNSLHGRDRWAARCAKTFAGFPHCSFCPNQAGSRHRRLQTKCTTHRQSELNISRAQHCLATWCPHFHVTKQGE